MISKDFEGMAGNIFDYLDDKKEQKEQQQYLNYLDFLKYLNSQNSQQEIVQPNVTLDEDTIN